MIAISARDRRVLLVGGSVMALIAGVGRSVPWLRAAHADAVALAAERRAQADVAERLTEARPAIERSLAEAARALGDLDARVFEGATVNGGAAAAASWVSRVAREQMVELSSVQVQVDTVARAGLTLVTLTAGGTTDVLGLMGLLRELEGGGKLLRVWSMSVTQPDVAAEDDVPETLRLHLVVHALVSTPRGTKR